MNWGNLGRNIAVIAGILIMTSGVLFGLWVAIWWGWVLGIVMIVEAFKATPVEAMNFALGVVRVIFANLLGALAGWLVFSLGAWIGSLAVGPWRTKARSKWG